MIYNNTYIMLSISCFCSCCCCWYCKDHIDWLHDDHICFDLKPQILQLHNWIDWVLSILCLFTVKQPDDDLQLVQQPYDGTFIMSSSTPNWTNFSIKSY